MNDDEDIDGEGEVIDLDSRRTPPPPPPTRGQVGVFLHPDLEGKPTPPTPPKPHPFTGKTPTERAIPTGGYKSKRQAALAKRFAKECADRIAFYDAAYESTLDAALCDYYRKMAAEEGVQEHLQTPEDTLHVLSCLRYRWIARVFKRPCFDYRYDLWEDGSIREIDAIRLLGLLGGIGLYVPRRAMPLIHKSDRWDDLPPSHLRLLAPYCSWIEVKTTPARSQEAARV